MDAHEYDEESESQSGSNESDRAAQSSHDEDNDNDNDAQSRHAEVARIALSSIRPIIEYMGRDGILEHPQIGMSLMSLAKLNPTQVSHMSPDLAEQEFRRIARQAKVRLALLEKHIDFLKDARPDDRFLMDEHWTEDQVRRKLEQLQEESFGDGSQQSSNRPKLKKRKSKLDQKRTDGIKKAKKNGGTKVGTHGDELADESKTGRHGSHIDLDDPLNDDEFVSGFLNGDNQTSAPDQANRLQKKGFSKSSEKLHKISNSTADPSSETNSDEKSGSQGGLKKGFLQGFKGGDGTSWSNMSWVGKKKGNEDKSFSSASSQHQTQTNPQAPTPTTVKNKILLKKEKSQNSTNSSAKVVAPKDDEESLSDDPPLPPIPATTNPFWAKIEGYFAFVRNEDMALLLPKSDHTSDPAFGFPTLSKKSEPLPDTKTSSSSIAATKSRNAKYTETLMPPPGGFTDLPTDVQGFGGEQSLYHHSLGQRILAALVDEEIVPPMEEDDLSGDDTRIVPRGIMVPSIPFEDRLKMELKSLDLLDFDEMVPEEQREDDEVSIELRIKQQLLRDTIQANNSVKQNLYSILVKALEEQRRELKAINTFRKAEQEYITSQNRPVKVAPRQQRRRRRNGRPLNAGRGGRGGTNAAAGGALDDFDGNDDGDSQEDGNDDTAV
eukprot:TRINITY_DN8075_c0_g1_i1.p1 TRINITY_DN8075_c0_g1~~TRINITY_DN8075_c0_g1_i1.p1  ORF type:complete len:663 (+),score=157.01 TRINITY_DN8075_c0_g1_i1:56-2044(+)